MITNNWVFLDLETTGLNPQCDSILEVAAVCFGNQGEQEVFHHLVNPGIPIPPQITRITGIDDKMVCEALSFGEIKTKLQEFLAEKIIVAHNAGFDVSFLQAAFGYPLQNNSIDTCELAKILFPGFPSYSLQYLTRVLNLEGELPRHRAYSDTLALERLFYNLLDRAQKLSMTTLQEIVYIFQQENNGLTALFKQILQDKVSSFDFSAELPSSRVSEEGSGQEIKGDEAPWDMDYLAKLLAPGGQIAGGIKNYQNRAEQIRMLKAVSRAFEENRHLIVEAGTGVGKSLAYLIPALVWSVSQGERVVVSTHTIALQEQLIQSDIGFLKKSLDFKFRAEVLKGRANYLCLSRWQNAKENIGTLNWAQRLILARISSWLGQDEGWKGDRDSLNLRDWEQEQFFQLSASRENCTGSVCPFVRDCFYQKARQRASSAHIIIVNHSLLLSDLKRGETVLPKYQYLIIDEAHHLEEEGTKQFSQCFSLREYTKKLHVLSKKRVFTGKSGLLNYWLQRVKDSKLGSNVTEDIRTEITGTKALLDKINGTVQDISCYIESNSDLELARVHEGIKESPWWKNLSLLFENLLVETEELVSFLKKLAEFLYGVAGVEDSEEPVRELKILTEQLSDDYKLLRGFFRENQSENVYWLEKDRFKKDLRLNASPLEIKNLFQELLFLNKNSIILTSATLSINESFTFLIEQLGIPEDLVDTAQIPSPFLYDEQSLLLVDTSLPDPARTSEEGYTLALKEVLLQHLGATGGNTLVLFTSQRQMRDLFEGLHQPLREAGLDLYVDGINGRRHVLISELKNNPQAVVFGTNTFWEGIDLPGQSLTSVIIVRLPFLPPSLPLVEARSEEMKKKGQDGFYHYSLPQAVLRFRQGYGRLIRTMDDMGVVIVLDNRVIKKRYGKVFINSLPSQNYSMGDTKTVAEKTKQWLSNYKI